MTSKKLELSFACSLFFFLLVFGLKNILLNEKAITNSNIDTTKGLIKGASIKQVNNKIRIMTDESLSAISIYSDINKTEEIARAERGTVFDLVSKNDRWTNIKLDDGTYGFIESKYTEIIIN